MREVVLFDFDGTVTKRDTVVPFVRKCQRFPRLVLRALLTVITNPRRVISFDRDFVKEKIVAGSLVGLRYTRVEKVVSVHCEEILRRNIRPSVMRLMQDHRKKGHEVVLVSASFGLYLRQVASMIGANEVLATELEVKDGFLTGRLLTKNCRSLEKANRVRRWLSINPTAVIVAAYGNSRDDLPMMALARVGYLISAREMKEVSRLIDY